MSRSKLRWRAEGGYSLLEMVFVTGIIGVLSAMGVAQIGNTRNYMKGDAAMRVIIGQLNQAREAAITQRRYVEVTFDTVRSEISTIREDTTATKTTLGTYGFEGGATFTLISALPDTPDMFGKATSTSFSSTNGTFASATGSANIVKFAPDGSLVDWNGRMANGTVFLSIANTPTSARAITILGSTGRIRGYRYDGRNWVKV